MQNPPAPTNDVHFGPLMEAVRSGNCVAVVGAGLSVPDYPLWTALIDTLYRRCDLRPEDVASDDPLDIAEAARRKSRVKYFAALDELFCSFEHPKCARRYHLLARINFKGYLTLNFDPLLVQVLECHRDLTVSDYPVLQSEHLRDGELFYVHGRLGSDRPSESTALVLTRSDFEEAYSPYHSRLHSFLQQTFLDNDVCLIGCNPREANMRRLLTVCKQIRESEHGLRSPSKPRWFLLHDEDFAGSSDLYGSGIDVVVFPKVDSAYRGLDDVLAHLANKKPLCVRTPGRKSSEFVQNGAPPQ